MNQQFNIEPHKGIGPIQLGMTRLEVKSALGEKNYSGSSGNSDYFYENSIQVEFEQGKADFIGASYSDNYLVLYKGVNVFNTSSEELFTLIAANENNPHSYNSYEYLFPDQVVTLWDADEQYDHIGKETRVVWAQIGIGSKNYLEAVSKINA